MINWIIDKLVIILKLSPSEIELLWQLFALYRGYCGNDVYALKKSNFYGNKLLFYHPKSFAAERILKIMKQ